VKETSHPSSSLGGFAYFWEQRDKTQNFPPHTPFVVTEVKKNHYKADGSRVDPLAASVDCFLQGKPQYFTSTAAERKAHL
jgi:hypothetical protein